MANTNEYTRGHLCSEREINPAPEVMVHSAPEVVQTPPNNISTGNDGANDAGLFRPDGDLAAPNDAEQTSQSKLRCRSRLWTCKTIIGICIGLIILAIVIPVIVTLVASDRGHDTENIETTAISFTLQASYSPSVTSTPSSAIPYPSSTMDSCVKSKFIKAVNWIGIDRNMGGWEFNLHQANTAEECCAICYHSTHDGCNGWLYMTTESFAPSCSIIHGFAGPNTDDNCPNGRPGIVFAETDNSDNYGGPGPCTGSVRV
ncbi:hypothetical protein LX36DRAFT_687299 [Colletotrichum falcatum]|nr:hypothetical protein LX36DRAFT_687299 [Colletotrichum falcatum]